MDANECFVYLDFVKKQVYYAAKRKDLDDLPATQVQYRAFVEHFLKKGKKECSFTMLKQYVEFHGVRKKGVVYDTVEITDKLLYLNLLKYDKEDIGRAIRLVVQAAGKHSIATDRRAVIQKATKRTLKLIIQTLTEEMEKL
jgi:hypothetical protein